MIPDTSVKYGLHWLVAESAIVAGTSPRAQGMTTIGQTSVASSKFALGNGVSDIHFRTVGIVGFWQTEAETATKGSKLRLQFLVAFD